VESRKGGLLFALIAKIRGNHGSYLENLKY